MMPWEDRLDGYQTPGVMFWWIFIDSPGYDTSGRLTRQGIIPWEGCLAGVLYPGLV